MENILPEMPKACEGEGQFNITQEITVNWSNKYDNVRKFVKQCFVFLYFSDVLLDPSTFVVSDTSCVLKIILLFTPSSIIENVCNGPFGRQRGTDKITNATMSVLYWYVVSNTTYLAPWVVFRRTKKLL